MNYLILILIGGVIDAYNYEKLQYTRDTIANEPTIFPGGPYEFNFDLWPI